MTIKSNQVWLQKFNNVSLSNILQSRSKIISLIGYWWLASVVLAWFDFNSPTIGIILN